MIREDDSSSYEIWPFKAVKVSPDGDRNNGGIDLVGNPERIDEIHEATEENGLRQLLIAMNAPGRAFMTLGCLAGQGEDAYHSYVEFTPRDGHYARNEIATQAVHTAWLKWISENCTDFPGLEDALRHNVVWVYRAFSLRGNERQYLITVYSRARNAQDHGSLLSWLHNFLCGVDLEAIAPKDA
jgi:hypothetical protein